MIESSIQENGIVESIFNFPTTLTAQSKKLVIVENIYDKKISKVNVCGIQELESNVMHKLGVDLIQYPNYSCTSVYTNSQTQKVFKLCHHLHTHKTLGIRYWPKAMYKIKTQKTTNIEGKKGANRHYRRSFVEKHA